MIIIRVKLIYMVWDVVSMSNRDLEIAVLQLTASHLYRIFINVCFSQPYGFCIESREPSASPRPSPKVFFQLHLPECFVCGPLLKFRQLMTLLRFKTPLIIGLAPQALF